MKVKYIRFEIRSDISVVNGLDSLMIKSQNRTKCFMLATYIIM